MPQPRESGLPVSARLAEAMETIRKKNDGEKKLLKSKLEEAFLDAIKYLRAHDIPETQENVHQFILEWFNITKPQFFSKITKRLYTTMTWLDIFNHLKTKLCITSSPELAVSKSSAEKPEYTEASIRKWFVDKVIKKSGQSRAMNRKFPTLNEITLAMQTGELPDEKEFKNITGKIPKDYLSWLRGQLR